MKYVFIAAALALAVRAPAFAQTTCSCPPPVSTMTLPGDGLVQRAPDIARLSVSIVTNDDNAIVSSSKNNDIYNALKARAATLGLASDALSTTAYNVVFVPHPPRDLPPAQQQPRYGYVTTRSMLVTVTPIENVGQVVDAATAAGVTNVGSISFDLKDRKAAFNAALAAAMGDAKSTAQLLASSGGFTIVRIQSLTVTSQNVPLVAVGRVMSLAAIAPTPTVIDPSGPISISAHISVTYVIK